MSDDSSESDALNSNLAKGRFRIALLCTSAVIFLFFATQFVGSLVLNAVATLSHWQPGQAAGWLKDSVAAQFAYGLIVDILLMLGIMGMLKRLGWTWQTIGLRSPKVWHIVIGIVTVVPYYALLYAIVVALQKLIPALDTTQKQELGFDSIYGNVSIVLAFISLVVLPPFIEEVVMRGFLYTGLKVWLPKVIAAVAVSALFGAAHLAEGGSGGPLWIGAIDTFTLSLFLVALREFTGNLWAGITLHSLKNGLAFMMFLIARLH